MSGGDCVFIFIFYFMLCFIRFLNRVDLVNSQNWSIFDADEVMLSLNE